MMWEKLDLVRIYTKPKGLMPDYSSPVVLRRSRCTVKDFCDNIHKDISKQLKCALRSSFPSCAMGTDEGVQMRWCLDQVSSILGGRRLDWTTCWRTRTSLVW